MQPTVLLFNLICRIKTCVTIVTMLPAFVNVDVMLTPGWFLHSTIVSPLAYTVDAVTCRVDVKFELIPLLAMLVRVAIKGNLETTTGSLIRVE